MEDIPHPLTAKRLKEVGRQYRSPIKKAQRRTRFQVYQKLIKLKKRQNLTTGDGGYNVTSTKRGNRQPYLNDYQKSSPGVFYADRNYIM